MKVQQRAVEDFESKLDISNIVAIQTHVILLIHLFLNKEQLLLFRHQHDRALTYQKKSIIDETSSDSESPKRLSPMTRGKRTDAFKKLSGYRVNSKLDQNLLVGMFEDPPKKS